jgi:hypothetical protein
MGEKRNVYRLLVENPQVKGPLGRPRHKWVDILEIRRIRVDWIGVPQDRNKWRALAEGSSFQRTAILPSAHDSTAWKQCPYLVRFGITVHDHNVVEFSYRISF